MKRYFFSLLMIVSGMNGISGPRIPYSQALEDYQCLLIYNFIKNIEWSESKVISIGILGNSKVLTIMTEKVESDKLNVIVKKIGFIEDVVNYDIVFIPKSQSSNASKASEMIDSKKVLLIAEDETIAKTVDFCFFIEKNKLRFSVNKSSTEKKGFKISAKLLQYAKVI